MNGRFVGTPRAFGAFRCLLILLLSCPGAVARAQVRGVVVETTEVPLDGVLVELWSATERLAAMVTDATGRFHFDAQLHSQPTVVLARRVGYRPARARVDSASVPLLIRMSEARVTMDALTILAPRSACSGTDSPEARVLWSAMTRRYEEPDSTACGQRSGNTER